MGQITASLPSGLTVVLDAWNVLHENIAADPATLREGKPKTRLLAAITLDLTDPGPYPFQGGKVDWEKVSHGDREVACRDNRVNTWGPDYFPSVPCGLCSTPYADSFDLRSFPTKPYPAEAIEHLRTNEPLEVELPSGLVVRFRLWRGADEPRLAKVLQARESERSTEILKSHVVEVEGVSASELPFFLGAPDANDADHERIDGDDSSALREAIRQADAGVDQEGVWRCAKCGHRWVADVDFGRDFFFPKSRKTFAFKMRSRSSPTSPAAPASPSPGGKT